MNWWIIALLSLLTLALIVLIVIRTCLKRRLDSIDGLVGLTRRGAYQGKVIGGSMTNIYPHSQSNYSA